MTTRYRVECESYPADPLLVTLLMTIRCTQNPSPGSIHRYAHPLAPIKPSTRAVPGSDAFLRCAYVRSEWIKGLLAVPFVLHSQPTGVFETRSHTVQQMAEEAHRRYAEIMQDVEDMVDDHSQSNSTHPPLRLV